jgi:hypothetical protein
MVTANGDRPRRRMFLPAIFVWPNDAPCLAFPYTGRSNESMSMYARSAIPASTGVRSAEPSCLLRCRARQQYIGLGIDHTSDGGLVQSDTAPLFRSPIEVCSRVPMV